MKFVNSLTTMSSFLEWIVSSIRGVKIIVWCCVIGFAISVCDILHERNTGIAETAWGSGHEKAERSDKPKAFESIIHFEMLRSAGLLLIALVASSMIASVKSYDVFAPGQEFETLK